MLDERMSEKSGDIWERIRGYKELRIGGQGSE